MDDTGATATWGPFDGDILCAQWRKILHTSPQKAKEAPIFPSKCDSACTGCCVLLRAAKLLGPLHGWQLGLDDPNPEFRISSRSFRGASWLAVSSINPVERNADALLYAIDGTPNPWGLRGCHPSATSADSPAAIDLLRHWLEECSKTHSRCVIPADSALPTRVLDLGFAASDTITLCETNGATGRYICLSYCWGQAGFINTTQRTLEDRKRGIAIGALPQTFQDTIHIARALGVQYVWIDSLCIIQKEGDHADWKRESGRMADVYRNSYLTVAATGANSAYGGCFGTPESGVNIGPAQMRAIRHFPSTATIGSSASFPLLTRAWAYQERLLAPRVVHFGRQELTWECREHRTCECGQGRCTKKQVNKSDFHDTISEFRWDKPRTPQQTWRQMVMQYSPLELTEASDKLPAFSGLADEMQRNSKQDYLAGIWRDSLILDMCWHRPISENNKPSCEVVWRAPSWSWASVDGPVEYYHGLYSGGPNHENGDRQYPEVIAAECSLAGPSLTGQVSHGYVELCGCMVPASGKGNSIDTIGRLISSFTWHSDERCIIEEQGEYYFLPLARIGKYFCGIVVKTELPRLRNVHSDWIREHI